VAKNDEKTVLEQLIPSHTKIAGTTALVSCHAQRTPCYACIGTGHLIQHCPKRSGLRSGQRCKELQRDRKQLWWVVRGHGYIR